MLLVNWKNLLAKKILLLLTLVELVPLKTLLLVLYENGEYKKFTYSQLVEVVNFTGNITFKDDEPKIHTHTTLSYEEKDDIKTLAGHFFSAKVAVTLELILHSYNTKIERKYNQDSKIDTWNIE